MLLRLVEFRRKAVGKRVRLTNELTQLLKKYFPDASDWAGDLDRPMACDFLATLPTLQIVKKRAAAVAKFYRQHGARSSAALEHRLKADSLGRRSDHGSSRDECSVAMLQALIPQLRSKHRQHPDSAIFISFPGTGAAIALPAAGPACRLAAKIAVFAADG